MGFPRVTKRMYQDGVKNLLKISIADEHHLYLELLASRSSTESQIIVVAYGEFTLTLENVTKQNMLPLFTEARPTRIVLEENDQVVEIAYRNHGRFEDVWKINLLDQALML